MVQQFRVYTVLPKLHGVHIGDNLTNTSERCVRGGDAASCRFKLFRPLVS